MDGRAGGGGSPAAPPRADDGSATAGDAERPSEDPTMTASVIAPGDIAGIRGDSVVSVLPLRPSDSPSLPPFDPPALGRLDRYEVLGRIARGGMADILLCRERIGDGLSRLLVVKCMRDNLADHAELISLFENEARLSMRFSHPNLCAVMDIGVVRQRHFIAMEWVRGVSLAELFALPEEHRLPTPLAVRIAAQVAEALDHAHRLRDDAGNSLGLVHRDVSPHNIMVSFDGVVKLLDFGIAKARGADHTTEAGAVRGKFAYMSPEQALAKRLDARSDVFSLGICLYELLTHRRLYARGADYDTLSEVISGEVPKIRDIDPTVPEDLEAIVGRALAKERRDRFQSAGEFSAALAGWLADHREVASSAQLSHWVRSRFAARCASGPTLDTDLGMVPISPLGGVGHHDPLATPPLPAASPGFLSADDDGPMAIAKRSRRAMWIVGGVVATGCLGALVAALVLVGIDDPATGSNGDDGAPTAIRPASAPASTNPPPSAGPSAANPSAPAGTAAAGPGADDPSIAGGASEPAGTAAADRDAGVEPRGSASRRRAARRARRARSSRRTGTSSPAVPGGPARSGGTGARPIVHDPGF